MLLLGSQNGTVINTVILRPELFTAAFIQDYRPGPAVKLTQSFGPLCGQASFAPSGAPKIGP